MKVWLVTAYNGNETAIKAICKTKKKIATQIQLDCYKLDEEDGFAYYDGYDVSEEEVIE